MLQLWWEDTAVILQRKRVLTGREGREFDWNKLGDMKEEEIGMLIREDIGRKDIVIVIDEEDLKIIGDEGDSSTGPGEDRGTYGTDGAEGPVPCRP